MRESSFIFFGLVLLACVGVGKANGVGVTFCSSITARACEIAYTDYPYGMFFLTRREQMVVIFILTSLFLGAGIRHYRLERMLPSQSHPSH